MTDPPTSSSPLRIFATVGSTRFDSLVHSLLSPSTLLSIANLSHLISDSQHAEGSSSSSTSKSTSKPPRSPMATLTIQYGLAPLSDILISPTSPFLTSDPTSLSTPLSSTSKVGIDPNSPLIPSPGLRLDSKGSLSWTGVARSRLDPGMTGSLNLSLDQLGFGEGSGEEEGQVQQSATTDVDLGKIFYPNGIAGEDKLVDDAHEEERLKRRRGAAEGGTLEIVTKQGVKVRLVDFVKDVGKSFRESDVVVSHAGSGSIIECLRLPSPPLLIVVPNTGLMDNHQVELADGLERRGHLLSASPESLPQVLMRLAPALGRTKRTTRTRSEGEEGWEPVPFPAFQPERFRSLVDEALGF